MKLINFLENDKERYICLFQLLKEGKITIEYENNNSYILKHKEDEMYFIIGDDYKLLDLLDKDDKNYYLFFNKELAEKFNLKNYMPVYNFYRSSNKKFDIDNTNYLFKLLDASYQDIVKEHSNYPKSYIKNRIFEKKLFGSFDKNNNLTGFIGCHSEKSIGMLHVLKEYRNKGIATFLEKNMINYFIDNNYIQFCQVELSNIKSMNLQEKLGFKKANKLCYWCWD